jgi:hypothetical protein
MEIGFVAIIADGFLDHILELSPSVLINFDILKEEKKMKAHNIIRKVLRKD